MAHNKERESGLDTTVGARRESGEIRFPEFVAGLVRGGLVEPGEQAQKLQDTIASALAQAEISKTMPSLAATDPVFGGNETLFKKVNDYVRTAPELVSVRAKIVLEKIQSADSPAALSALIEETPEAVFKAAGLGRKEKYFGKLFRLERGTLDLSEEVFSAGDPLEQKIRAIAEAGESAQSQEAA